APGGQMQGAATQSMPLRIAEERQRRRCPPAAAPLRAAARRPAGCVARSLHTAPGMLVARALPAGLGASSKMYTLFPDGPLAVKALSGINREDAKSAKNLRRRILSKRQRICALVVRIGVHLCSSVVSFMPAIPCLGSSVSDRPQTVLEPYGAGRLSDKSCLTNSGLQGCWDPWRSPCSACLRQIRFAPADR